ncbi:MAG: RNA polymerase sigma factor [Armatimonadota bacterium]
MARSIVRQRSERQVDPGPGAPTMLDHEREEMLRLTRLVKVAIGRLGGSVSPWLDEGLLMGQGLATLLELTRDADESVAADGALLGWVVGGMRSWVRASSWYRASWRCRIAPLCSSLAERPPGGAGDSQIAGDLGLDRERLSERYAEAGLLFGVSPELLLPSQIAASGARRVTDAVSALPLDERKLLALYFEDGLSFPEIAQVLEITPAEAQTTYGRAATSIRAHVFGTRQLSGRPR